MSNLSSAAIIVEATTTAEMDTVANIFADSMTHDFPYKEETIHHYRDVIFNQEHFRKTLSDEKYVTFVAKVDEKVVGFIQIMLDFGGVIFIDQFFVDKEYRGQGIGTQLIAEMETWAKAHNYHYLYLYTETPKNIAYYQSRGFRQAGVHENAWFGENEYIMAKNI